MAALLLYFSALGVCLLVLRYLRSTWYHAQKAQEWNCAPIPRYPTDILGIGTLKESVQADKQGLVPPLLGYRLERMRAREGRDVTTFSVTQMGRKNIFTCDPHNVQAILATKFKDFELGPIRQHTLLPLLGTGIFTSDGEIWSRSRALLRPQFTREQISDLDLEERHVQQAMLAMPVDATTGWTAATDIQAIFFRLTIDSATEFLFGESAGSQAEALRNGGQLPPNNFPAYFDRAQWYAAHRSRFEKLHWIVDNKESRHVAREVHAYVDRFVAAALSAAATAAPGKPRSSSTYVFLDAIVASTQDPVELRAQLLNILIAGRDTTASFLSWSVLMLARHPKIFHTLRLAILDDFGPYTSSSSSAPQDKPITFQSLKSCRPLQNFMSEVLRLYPVVPINRRVAARDTFLPRGGGPDGTRPVYIHAGQAIIYSPFITQRRKDLWGEDAETFNPDRWAGRKVGWEYLPSMAGRACASDSSLHSQRRAMCL
ncbi:hypothetical protein ARAM_006638 [Aspergillus rambellii]|uniref:Cytochrome P450 n=1 Tax=Aspergillus rambellii TaxID=308745 RepID=A0A0F8V3I1_9EURO|nr:hypothetical protein ARAM_006638 [Aspergillus rambellii]